MTIEKDYSVFDSIKKKTDDKIHELVMIIEEKNELIQSLEKDNLYMKKVIEEYSKSYHVKRKRYLLWSIL